MSERALSDYGGLEAGRVSREEHELSLAEKRTDGRLQKEVFELGYLTEAEIDSCVAAIRQWLEPSGRERRPAQ